MCNSNNDTTTTITIKLEIHGFRWTANIPSSLSSFVHIIKQKEQKDKKSMTST